MKLFFSEKTDLTTSAAGPLLRPDALKANVNALELLFSDFENTPIPVPRSSPMSASRVRASAVIATAALAAALVAASPAGANDGWGINGTFATSSNGDFAKVNERFQDQPGERSTWTITTQCVSPTECTGTVTSDKAGVRPSTRRAGCTSSSASYRTGASAPTANRWKACRSTRSTPSGSTGTSTPPPTSTPGKTRHWVRAAVADVTNGRRSGCRST